MKDGVAGGVTPMRNQDQIEMDSIMLEDSQGSNDGKGPTPPKNAEPAKKQVINLASYKFVDS